MQQPGIVVPPISGVMQSGMQPGMMPQVMHPGMLPSGIMAMLPPMQQQPQFGGEGSTNSDGEDEEPPLEEKEGEEQLSRKEAAQTGHERKEAARKASETAALDFFVARRIWRII